MWCTLASDSDLLPLLAAEDSDSEEDSSDEEEEVGLLGKRKNKDAPTNETPNKKAKITEESSESGECVGGWEESVSKVAGVSKIHPGPYCLCGEMGREAEMYILFHWECPREHCKQLSFSLVLGLLYLAGI